MSGYRWTAEEEQLLTELHKTKMSYAEIGKRLGKRAKSVMQKAQRMGLHEPYCIKGDRTYVNLKRLAVNTYHGSKTAGEFEAFLRENGFDGFIEVYIRSRGAAYTKVCMKQFWTWAKEHQELFKLAAASEKEIGEMPEWAKEKRDRDRRALNRWSSDELKQLEELLKEYKYTYSDLSRLTGRTANSIRHKILNCGFKQRPLPEVKE